MSDVFVGTLVLVAAAIIVFILNWLLRVKVN